MKQPLFIKNVAIDEKRISFIETIVARLARRTRKTVAVIMPPLPISACVIGDDVRGDILRYMFCSDGTVDRLSISLNAKPKETVDVEFRILGEESERAAIFFHVRRSESFGIEELVKKGEKVVISIYPRDPEEKLTEVWAAFVWTPLVNDSKVTQLLIDDLEKVAGEIDA